MIKLKEELTAPKNEYGDHCFSHFWRKNKRFFAFSNILLVRNSPPFCHII